MNPTGSPLRRRAAAVLLAPAFLLLSACGDYGLETPPGPVAEISGARLRRDLAAPDPPVLLDVRTAGEFSEGRIEGAVNIPIHELGRRLEELRPHEGRTLVVYCEVGPRAELAVRFLRGRGFGGAVLYRPGMAAWRKSKPRSG